MKLGKKTTAKEVKRAFVIADLVRDPHGKKRQLKRISSDPFKKRLKKVEQRVRAMSDKRLDAYIHNEYPRRLKAYEEAVWHIGTVSPREVGVWRKAGGLPLAWTNQSLAHTARHVSQALKHKLPTLKGRAKRVIPDMLGTNIDLIQAEKSLLPIIFKGDTGTRGRRLLKHKVTGDIDDGNMRSIALAVNGAKVIRAYIGMPKKKHVS